MNEIEILKTNNLLNQVGLIRKKYDDLAEYTGENYNIFDVLNIYHHELSHSAIIGNLLNAQGKHGQKDIFLKLFLKRLPSFQEDSEQYKELNNFQSKKSKTYIERHIGKVDYEKSEGGRIDILLNDGKNNIIIENKVWAGDQYLQLVRYNNQYKTSPIIYLTLDGKEPSNSSKDNLVLGKDYVCLSYKIEIVRWIEKCIKKMANKPIIRESLNQYLVLVKQLTNQSTNNKMKEEIITLIQKNIKSSHEVYINFIESKSNILNKIRDGVHKELEVKLIELYVTKERNVIESNSSICLKLNSKDISSFFCILTFSGELSSENLLGKEIFIGILDFEKKNHEYFSSKSKKNNLSQKGWWWGIEKIDSFDNYNIDFSDLSFLQYLADNEERTTKLISHIVDFSEIYINKNIEILKQI